MAEVGEDDENREWTCAHCPKTRLEDLNPYTHKLLRLRMLRAAGYPFEANDLTYEEWLDLGRLNQWLETPVPSRSKSESMTKDR